MGTQFPLTPRKTVAQLPKFTQRNLTIDEWASVGMNPAQYAVYQVVCLLCYIRQQPVHWEVGEKEYRHGSSLKFSANESGFGHAQDRIAYFDTPDGAEIALTKIRLILG